MRLTPRMIAVFCAGICTLGWVSACAPWGTRQQEVLLSAAGFRVRHPETPQQQQMYSDAPAYTLIHGMVNGQNFYAYKDRFKGIAYVGGPIDYYRYQELSYQEEAGRVDDVREEMPAETASGWYDAWTGQTGVASGPLEAPDE